jgi:sigma-B regulation protein RsbU (phosphoserine phosphatase)
MASLVDPICAAIHERIVGGKPQRAPGIAVTGWSQPCDELGGDWWACHVLGSGRALVAIGDVAGHDVASALVASMACGVLDGAVRALGDQTEAHEVIELLGAALVDVCGLTREMTCCVAILDPASGTMDVAGAGHPFPLLLRANGAVETLVTRGAPLAGTSPRIGRARASIAPGDVLLLATDGVYERLGRNGRRFGARRVCDILVAHRDTRGAGLHRLRSSMVAALRTFAAATPPDDDLTLVVCEYREQIGDVRTAVMSRAELESAIDAMIEDATDRISV